MYERVLLNVNLGTYSTAYRTLPLLNGARVERMRIPKHCTTLSILYLGNSGIMVNINGILVGCLQTCSIMSCQLITFGKYPPHPGGFFWQLLQRVGGSPLQTLA